MRIQWLRRLVGRELRVLAAVGGLRRRSVPPGEQVIGYAGRLTPVLIVMVVVSLLELGAVELFVPWTGLRWVLAALGGYGLLWVAGFAGALHTRPHGLGADVLHLRFATFTEVAVPVRSAVTVGESLGSHERTVEVGDGRLAVSVMGLTNVTVTFESTVDVTVGGSGPHPVRQVSFYADQPAAAARLLTRSAGGRQRTSG